MTSGSRVYAIGYIVITHPMLLLFFCFVFVCVYVCAGDQCPFWWWVCCSLLASFSCTSGESTPARDLWTSKHGSYSVFYRQLLMQLFFYFILFFPFFFPHTSEPEYIHHFCDKNVRLL